MDTIKRYLFQLRDKASQKNIQDIHFYVEQIRSLRIIYENTSIDQWKEDAGVNIYVEGQYNGNIGSCYIDDMDEGLFDLYISKIIESADNNDRKVDEKTFEAESIQPFDFVMLAPNAILDILKKTDEMTFGPLVKSVNQSVSCTQKIIWMIDAEDNEIMDTTGGIQYGARVVAEKDGYMENGSKNQFSKTLDKLTPKKWLQAAEKIAIDALDGKILSSGNRPVVLSATVVSEMLHQYATMFYGNEVVADTTLLKDKMNQSIATKGFSMTDDPTFMDGEFYRQVDDEGVKTQSTPLIEHGKLVGFLHNKETAKKLNTTSTGNGFKSNYKSKATITATNLIIEAGNTPFSEIVQSIDNGVYITEISGAFAGIHADSGMFSLLSAGYEITNGKLGDYVQEITIAGNIFDLLLDIEDMSIEREASYASKPYVLAPHIHIKALTIAGA